MSQADVSSLTAAVTGIQIDGPGGPRLDPTGRVELTEETLLTVLPGELDPAVGSHPAPEPEPEDDDEAPVDEQATKRIVREAEDALFNAHAYDATPTIDGQPSDLLQITLGGGVKLEASDEDAQLLFAALKLGRFVTFQGEGYVSAKSGSYSENSEGESKVVGKATIKATDIRLLRPEDLS